MAIESSCDCLLPPDFMVGGGTMFYGVLFYVLGEMYTLTNNKFVSLIKKISFGKKNMYEGVLKVDSMSVGESGGGTSTSTESRRKEGPLK